MTLVIELNRTLLLMTKHVYQRADGLCFYERRIPKDLKAYYPDIKGPSIRKSLGTKDPMEAARRAAKRAAEDDALWKSLRSPQASAENLTTPEVREGAKALLAKLDIEPGDGLNEWADQPPIENYLRRQYGDDYARARYHHPDPASALDELVSPREREAIRLCYEDPNKPKKLLLSEVVTHYLEYHPSGHKSSHFNAVHLCLRVIVERVGDLPLESYTRDHARTVRDHLLSRKTKTTTVRRRLRTINAFFTHGIEEAGHTFASPFARLKLPKEGEDAATRVSFSTDELRTIARAAKEQDDEIRHIVAMLLDTGARLGEIVGLQAADLRLHDAVPHVLIRPDRAKDRTLKTPQSIRRVPLVGLALWGANRASAGMSEGQKWVYPRYAADRNIRATHASNTINKWLRRVIGADKTAHSLRHSMRDRLRAAAVPGELQDLIGGWGSLTVGQRYGEGYPLETLRAELIKVVLD
jgi:integrase